MVKIDQVIGQMPLSDRFTRKIGQEKDLAPKDPGADVVLISEEGKKKHILGQVLSRLSGDSGGKKAY